jgi:hypothetical protein
MSTQIVEPDNSFKQAWCKVVWAEQHIINLNKLRDFAVEKHPRSCFIEQDEKGSSYLKFDTKPLPPAFSLMTGDAVHNLRTALDYCWMGLRRSISPDPGKHTLPRGVKREEVEGTLRKAAIEQSIEGIDAFVLDRIKPYRDGNYLLWLLGQLDNRNKHNLLITTLAASHVRKMSLSSKSGRISDIQITDGQFGGPLRLIGTDDPTDPLQIDGEPDVAVEVVLLHGKMESEGPLIPFMVASLKETAQAVKLFYATFGKDPPKNLGV